MDTNTVVMNEVILVLVSEQTNSLIWQSNIPRVSRAMTICRRSINALLRAQLGQEVLKLQFRSVILVGIRLLKLQIAEMLLMLLILGPNSVYFEAAFGGYGCLGRQMH